MAARHTNMSEAGFENLFETMKSRLGYKKVSDAKLLSVDHSNELCMAVCHGCKTLNKLAAPQVVCNGFDGNLLQLFADKTVEIWLNKQAPTIETMDKVKRAFSKEQQAGAGAPSTAPAPATTRVLRSRGQSLTTANLRRHDILMGSQFGSRSRSRMSSESGRRFK